jgi:hypothetical protein
VTDTIDQELELETLKTLADDLGVKYHPSIGLEKLKEKVAEASTAEPEVEEAAPAKKSLAEIKKEQLKLVRCRISCMNPVKSEWQGEMFTVGNRLIGTQTKYVPFETEWHVPQVIFDFIKNKKYQHFYTVKDSHGRKIRKGKQANEFVVEELKPLTEQELKDLAQRQAMANGTADTI